MKLMNELSKELVSRMPRYLRYLGDYLSLNLEKISSADLARKMGVTASQIRSDFSHFNFFGQQGYGYNVRQAYDEIKSVLGLNSDKNVIILGVGNIGKALASHKMFNNRGFKLVGLFDINSGGELNGIPILAIKDLKTFLQTTPVDIAVLSVPSAVSQDIAELIVGLGIKGILNFSYVDLHFDDVVVENVHIRDSLMTLNFKLNNKNLPTE